MNDVSFPAMTMMRRWRSHCLTLLLPVLAACGGDDPDAYGNFEAQEVRVSAEATGQLRRFEVDEGDQLPAGAVVGEIDATTLTLQRDELASQSQAARARATEAQAQIGVLQAQLVTATEAYERTRRLFRAEAATAQQLEQTEGEVRVLRERIEAARAQVNAARQEARSVEARVGQLSRRLEETNIVNPVSGTVLTTYASAGELVQAGQPLYTIADLRILTLRAYVSGAQLARIRTGDTVEVRIDAAEDELMSLSGEITWIAAEAEFTPTPIQTREERTTQVYAIDVRVRNPNGVLKIGMPGEVSFREAPGEGEESGAISLRPNIRAPDA